MVFETVQDVWSTHKTENFEEMIDLVLRVLKVNRVSIASMMYDRDAPKDAPVELPGCQSVFLWDVPLA